MIENIEQLRAQMMALMEITRAAVDPSKDPIDMRRGLGFASLMQSVDDILALPSHTDMMTGWGTEGFAEDIAQATGVPVSRVVIRPPGEDLTDLFWESRALPDRRAFATAHNVTNDWVASLGEVERYIRMLLQYAFSKIFPGDQWIPLCEPFCEAAPTIITEKALFVRSGVWNNERDYMRKLTDATVLLQYCPFIARTRNEPDEVIILVP